MKKKITFLTLVVPPAARRSALLLAALAIAVAPNLVWIWLDKTVWPWDPAWYGKHSVDLFVTLLQAVGVVAGDDGRARPASAGHRLGRAVLRADRALDRLDPTRGCSSRSSARRRSPSR